MEISVDPGIKTPTKGADSTKAKVKNSQSPSQANCIKRFDNVVVSGIFLLTIVSEGIIAFNAIYSYYC